jgi:hypothetical protein
MSTRPFAGSGTTVCVCEPQSSGTDLTSVMLERSLMSKIWMPSNPVQGYGAGAQSAPVRRRSERRRWNRDEYLSVELTPVGYTGLQSAKEARR